MTTDLTKVEGASVHSLPSPTRDVVVLARNPEEMIASQIGLITWAEQKLAAERAQLAEKQENLEEVKRAKHATSRWQRQVSLARKRVIYYEKILGALQEGYYIVPNFPALDTVVVRTKRSAPVAKTREGVRWAPTIPDVKSESLPVGAGQYVNPLPVVDHRTQKVRDERGDETVKHTITPIDFDAIDFPFSVVKPQILKDFNHALQLRIFDEIGVLPARQRRGDPMVIGTIKRREGYQVHEVSFLVSWWIDTRAL